MFGYLLPVTSTVIAKGTEAAELKQLLAIVVIMAMEYARCGQRWANRFPSYSTAARVLLETGDFAGDQPNPVVLKKKKTSSFSILACSRAPPVSEPPVGVCEY